MSITLEKAVETLGLKGVLLTCDIIKKNYRKLANKYHPDKNKDGLIFMQQLNIARDYLSTFTDDQLSFYSTQKTYSTYHNNFDDNVEEEGPHDELNIFRLYGLHVYHRNGKIIIEGKTYDYKEELKEHRFRWDPEKKRWWKYE